MKKICRMTYDNFIIDGEVNEQLPLYSENLDNVYTLAGSNDTLLPDCEIRSKAIVRGLPSAIKTATNITNIDNDMNFIGSSELILDGNLLNSNYYEFKIEFKVSDLSNVMNLLTCKFNSNNELSLMIDSDYRYIYADIKSQMSIISDINNTFYSITDSGTINKNIWYTLTVVREDNVSTVYLNNMLVKTLIYKEDFKCDLISIGKNFKGLIRSIETRTYKEDNTSDNYTINNNSLLNSFSSCFYFKPNSIGNYNIAKIGSLEITTTGNTLYILRNGESIDSISISENNVYYIALTHNKTQGEGTIYIFNSSTNNLLLKREIAINLLIDSITIVNNPSVYDLAIYKTCLEQKHILRNVTKKLVIEKNGNLNYNINEDDIDFKMRSNYYIPMLSSGRYEADDIIELINVDVLEKTSPAWNSNLHHKAYQLPNWSNGYNSGVTNPQEGYHAKWVLENSSKDTMCLKFTNCNSDFNMTNRWLGSYRTITADELWSKCKAGDNIKIIFEAKADIPCDIKVGIYKKTISTNAESFNSQQTIRIKDSSWNEYCYETIIDEDWNLAENARLYFYGNLTDKATSYIKSIYLIRNGNKAPLDIIKNKNNGEISIPIKEQVGITTPNFTVIYNQKLITKDTDIINRIGSISWGVKQGKLFLQISEEYSTREIDEIQLNEWITFAIAIGPTNIKVYLYNKEGKYSCQISNITVTNANIEDLILDSENCSLYKDLFVIKRLIVQDKIENHHRTKLSYYKDCIISKNEIVESKL